MQNQLNDVLTQARSEIGACKSPNDLNNAKARYLGKKSLLNELYARLKELAAEDRPAFGQMINDARKELESLIAQKEQDIKKASWSRHAQAQDEDLSLPGIFNPVGALHPLTIVRRQIEDIFMSMGFEIADGPDIDDDFHNFDALNTPADHPSRNLADTFYLDNGYLLRTQTSTVQVRVMEKYRPPIRIISPGRCYRNDKPDPSHSPVFHQVEGLVVDKGVTMGDLVGTLKLFVKSLFGEKTDIRLRPHHFPFTEPSAEVDVSCWTCGGSGCRVCKNEGWIEILGAGMVHPKVLEVCGIDPEVYSGFAFGLGVERTAMGRFNIDDLRLLYENDIRFLKQF